MHIDVIAGPETGIAWDCFHPDSGKTVQHGGPVGQRRLG
jgi:hypothetical protein